LIKHWKGKMDFTGENHSSGGQVMSWDWLPGVRCGGLAFGKPLSTDNLGLPAVLLEPDYEGADWETYVLGNQEARVHVKEGNVVSIECMHSLCFRGVEILGLSHAELRVALGYQPEKTRAWPDGSEMLEVAELGITLWSEHGRIESATVEPIDDRS
jgi:hypothetical protein